MNTERNRFEIDAAAFDTFTFLREEVRFEHRLVGQRISWYVGSQAFLVTAFAIAASGVRPSATNWFSYGLLPLLGIILSGLICPAATSASRRIEELWNYLDRYDTVDLMPPRHRLQHQSSLWFPRYTPFVFLAFWAFLLVRGRFIG